MDNYIQDQQTYNNCATMFACEVGISKEIAMIFVRRIPLPQSNSAEYDEYYNIIFDSLEFISERRLSFKEEEVLKLKEIFEKQYKPSKKDKNYTYFAALDKKRSSFMKYILFSILKFPKEIISLQKLHKISPLNSLELLTLYEWFCPFNWQYSPIKKQ